MAQEIQTKGVEYFHASDGRTLAMVIDDHSGGSATNRPLLFAYLSGLKSSLTQVKGVVAADTKFNGYDISSHVYLMPQ